MSIGSRHRGQQEMFASSKRPNSGTRGVGAQCASEETCDACKLGSPLRPIVPGSSSGPAADLTPVISLP